MMRCFLPCFAASKRRSNATPTQPPQTNVADGAASQPQQQKTAAESKFQEQSNERAEPQIGQKEDNHGLQEEECSESLFSLSIESRKQVSAASDKAETEVNSPMQLLGAAQEESNQIEGKISKGTGVESPNKDTDPLLVKPDQQYSGIEEDSNTNKVADNKDEKPKHPEYRYRDVSYEEEYEGINLNASDLDVGLEDDDDDTRNEERREEEGSDVHGAWVQEESSESLFSLSTDSRRPVSADNEVDSPNVKNAMQHVLNPIDNVTQRGRVVKSTVLKSLKMNDKENINNSVVVQQDVDVGMPQSPEHSLKLSKRKARQKTNDKEQEIRVDTSLSSWLEGTPISLKSNSSVGEQTPVEGGRGSPWSNEDRPILGALTVEEIRMYSVTSTTSSRRSRSKSPDETPIIGTVGSYWTHTGQILESNTGKTEKDAKLKSTSSTLKTRLERAFEASVS